MSEMEQDSKPSPDDYNDFYYRFCCGAPYERNETWMAFFRHLAQRIQAEIGAQHVLDAGCAKGFLVEALREQGVDAWGIDLSSHAIDSAFPAIKEYLKVASLTEKLEKRYDLIVSIEVLEHIPLRDAEAVLDNLCAHTDDILFSSSPFDYAEPTHINVRPPEFWSRLFAQRGFFRDLDFDASWLTPWATRYRRQELRIPELVLKYERRFWELRQAEVGSREHAKKVQGLLAESVKRVDALQAKNQQLETTVEDLRSELAQRQAEVEHSTQELRNLKSLRWWKIRETLDPILKRIPR